MSDIRKLIQDLKDPELKLTTFLRSPQLQDLCQNYNCNSLTEIHPSFANMDRFSLLIYKERLALYPQGQYLNGLQFQMERNSQLKEYVHLYENNDEKIQQWAAHKADPVIAAGLNRFCSRMDSSIFQKAIPHTNAGEQSHQKGYMWGKKLSLVKAVERAYQLDSRDVDQYLSRNNYNIHHSYRTDTIAQRYANSLIREQRKRRRQSSNSSLQAPIDTIEEPIQPYTSSGSPFYLIQDLHLDPDLDRVQDLVQGLVHGLVQGQEVKLHLGNEAQDGEAHRFARLLLKTA
ncbi:uncharacterized protein ATNIH1004_000848 [Aspergillus tanneri]|uniref:Uncharacterized protein n=1 Tax=Aspergillus tanneri TaxID=1220188 RepID=A0A5M9MYL7_9EURO|nr:uncharacterized protein ATNIH1004_000848 [Aspergillus tanneri]KAA8651948.1 hypothetical protein ATNIH1004_000848 [Aspergillus tanneri]